MPTGTFRRVILKGAREDRALFLWIAESAERQFGPNTGDVAMVKRFHTNTGPAYVRLTKRTIAVQREPFGSVATGSRRKQDG